MAQTRSKRRLNSGSRVASVCMSGARRSNRRRERKLSLSLSLSCSPPVPWGCVAAQEEREGQDRETRDRNRASHPAFTRTCVGRGSCAYSFSHRETGRERAGTAHGHTQTDGCSHSAQEEDEGSGTACERAMQLRGVASCFSTTQNLRITFTHRISQ